MNKILVIDPGKGWGHFVSKMYCYQKLAEELNTQDYFFNKKINSSRTLFKTIFFL
jgi:hypothetical protein